MSSSIRHIVLRAGAVLSLVMGVGACATTPQAPKCEAIQGLDPGCVIENRALLKEALDSYHAHYNKMDVGHSLTAFSRNSVIAFTTRWLRTDKFVVIDYSKQAYERRLYIVDFKTGGVTAMQVSHGLGSAENRHSYKAVRFTNLKGSGTSPVGAFVAGQEYASAKWGRALRLRGLDPTNDRTLERAIVFHSDERFFDRDRNIFGWSCGCFMTDASDLPEVIKVLQEGGFVYAGPISLYDRSTANKVSECNSECGGQDSCATASKDAPDGAVPDVAPPKPTAPTRIPYSVVPVVQPGETYPVPAPKPRFMGGAPVTVMPGLGPVLLNGLRPIVP